MRIKLLEKNLFAGIILLVVGVALLLSASLIQTPVRVSEKGIAVALAAIYLILFSVNLFMRSYKKY
jgi:hypothetical protein